MLYLVDAICSIGTVHRTNYPSNHVLQICVGNVLQSGAGALSSRVAQVRAGIPHTVPLSTVNRQCSSGLQAVAHIAAGIKAGYYAIGIAAGKGVVERWDLHPTC